MINEKIRNLLKEKGKSVYGLGAVLNVTPQNADYLVKRKDLTRDYNRIQKIAEYLEVEIEEMFN